MKAKACTLCRQWKARCDASDGVPGGCSRCRSLELTCVFDASFKRLSKTKQIQQMSAEIQKLRQALKEKETTPETCSSAMSAATHIPHPSSAAVTLNEPQPSSSAFVVWPTPLPTASEGTDVTSTHLSTSLPHDSIPTGSCSHATGLCWSLGDVCLARSQADRCFKTYFAHHHQYLPLKFRYETPDEIHDQSPLLFWVICAVTSSWKQQPQFAPLIKSMIADVLHGAAFSIETIQALIILSTWPFQASHISEAPMQFYTVLIVQMGLQLGLHRPGQASWPLRHGGLTGPSAEADEQIGITTWLATYVVSQMQASFLGVPPSIMADGNLVSMFQNNLIDRNLTQLCRIHHLLIQHSWEIGGNAATPTGLVPPDVRLSMTRLGLKDFGKLEQEHLNNINALVRISFLNAKLQLCAYVLLKDVPFSDDILDVVEEAEVTAHKLIEVAYAINLSVAPVQVRRAMCYGAFVLISLLQLPYNKQAELLYDSIERVRQSLSAAPDDLNRKAYRVFETLLYAKDQGLSAAILSRMSASIMYDGLRVNWEHCLESSIPEEFLGIDGFTSMCLDLSAPTGFAPFRETAILP